MWRKGEGCKGRSAGWEGDMHGQMHYTMGTCMAMFHVLGMTCIMQVISLERVSGR